MSLTGGSSAKETFGKRRTNTMNTEKKYLNDFEIRELCMNTEKPMISPFVNYGESNCGISRGLTTIGYDITSNGSWMCPFFYGVRPASRPFILDPKNPTTSKQVFEPLPIYTDDAGCRYTYIPPNTFALTSSLEYFKMPEDVGADAMGKSTYARIGVFQIVTPLEPGWEGNLVLELVNGTPHYAKVYIDEGLAQIRFFRVNRPERTYAEKKGKYQGQTGITFAKSE